MLPSLILQAAWFQAIWFCAVIGQNQWLAITILLLLGHAFFCQYWRRDLKIWPIALIGIGGDSLLTWLGIFEFSQIPYWLGLIWLAFALSLRYSLAWLDQLKLSWQSLIGALAGCLSYLAGERLEGVQFPMGILISSGIIALYWALLLPVLLHIKKRVYDLPQQ